MFRGLIVLKIAKINAGMRRVLYIDLVPFRKSIKIVFFDLYTQPGRRVQVKMIGIVLWQECLLTDQRLFHYFFLLLQVFKNTGKAPAPGKMDTQVTNKPQQGQCKKIMLPRKDRNISLDQVPPASAE